MEDALRKLVRSVPNRGNIEHVPRVFSSAEAGADGDRREGERGDRLLIRTAATLAVQLIPASAMFGSLCAPATLWIAFSR